MAEYLIQGEILSNLANKVRELDGTEEAMTPDEMSNAVETFNSDMTAIASEQTDLIGQIMIALDEKAAVSLPELENPAGSEQILSGYQGIDSDGNVIEGTYEPVPSVEWEMITISSNLNTTGSTNNYISTFNYSLGGVSHAVGGTTSKSISSSRVHTLIDNSIYCNNSSDGLGTVSYNNGVATMKWKYTRTWESTIKILLVYDKAEGTI